MNHENKQGSHHGAVSRMDEYIFMAICAICERQPRRVSLTGNTARFLITHYPSLITLPQQRLPPQNRRHPQRPEVQRSQQVEEIADDHEDAVALEHTDRQQQDRYCR